MKKQEDYRPQKGKPFNPFLCEWDRVIPMINVGIAYTLIKN